MQDNRINIRPVLNLTSIREEERFQNEVLRPILKLQNKLIILFFNAFSKKFKLDVSTTLKKDLILIISKFIKNNITVRNQFLGLVFGQFTEEEFLIYQEKESEYNKRILNMIAQRIVDNQ